MKTCECKYVKIPQALYDMEQALIDHTLGYNSRQLLLGNITFMHSVDAIFSVYEYFENMTPEEIKEEYKMMKGK